MTKYLGSKASHAAEIIRVATANRNPGQPWVEPFLGGGNVICRVSIADGPRIGADKNRYIIALLNAVGNQGWLPPETMTEAEWNKIKKNPDNYPPELVALAATGPVFGAKWFDTWARGKNNQGNARDYWRESRANVLNDAPGLRGVEFRVSDYAELSVPPGSLIYCDPPYAHTAGYKGSKTKIALGESLVKNEWRADQFWRWADKMVDEGHQVFVSEYKGPQPSVYSITDQALIAEDKTILALGKILDERKRGPSSSWPSPEECEVLFARRRALDALESKERARLAARWQVVWSKKVVSDFSSQRGTLDAGTVKEETELLLHRAL